jgi:hypothetical protein
MKEEKDKRDKVFCEDCIFLNCRYYKGETVFSCTSPDNLFYRDSWLRSWEYTKHPMELNKYSNCILFKSKKVKE